MKVNILENYRHRLEQMTDEELANEWVYEYGVNKEEVMADIEEERESYIAELVNHLKQVLTSRGEL